jgi:hypothetical protein
MLVAGAAVVWRRTTAWGAAALAVYYWLIVVILMDGRTVLRHYDEFIAYSNTAGQAAIAAGALIVYAAHARIDPVLAGPRAAGPGGVRHLRAAVRRRALLLHEPHRPAGADMAAAEPGILGLCDRRRPYRRALRRS